MSTAQIQEVRVQAKARRRGNTPWRAAVGISACALALIAASPRQAQASPVAVANMAVQAGAAPLGMVPATAFGLNASAYDAHLLDPAVPALVRATGVGIMRYPGGSEADVYHWQNNSITPGQGGYANPNDTFDNFMQVASAAGARAMITVNYGSNAAGTAGGDPREAAAWVRYANITKGYGVAYWEIGNELYGNGTYGAHWETDLHPDIGPAAYGQHANEFVDAMKAVDPSIKIGVVLTAPGNWPDEDVLHNAGTPQAWNDTVLRATCGRLDFVDVHWYPQDPASGAPFPESDPNLLQSPEQGIDGRTPSIPAMVARLRAEIAQACPGRAGQIGIMVTETNSVSYNPGKQTVSLVNALFLDDNYMTWLENGVANVDWWQLHNGPVTDQNNSPSLYGAATYGDYGILSTGDAPEPPANTPFPPYYGLQMLDLFARPGDRMVATSSDQALVTAHAVLEARRQISVLLINKDPNNSYDVKLSLCGYLALPTPATVYSYGMGSTAIASTRVAGPQSLHTPYTLTVPPYSLTTIVFKGLLLPGFRSTGCGATR